MKTLFSHGSERVVVGTHVELKEAVVVGGELHAKVHHAAVLVLLHDDAATILSAALVVPRLCEADRLPSGD